MKIIEIIIGIALITFALGMVILFVLENTNDHRLAEDCCESKGGELSTDNECMIKEGDYYVGYKVNAFNGCKLIKK